MTVLDYERFAAVRASLADTLAALSDSFHRLAAEKRAHSLAVSRDALLDDAFRVLVLGEFSRGKSTLINALVGAQLLPAKVAPCTAVITRLKYGPKKTAILRLRDTSEEHLDLASNPDALKQRITILDQQKSPIEYCDVFFPLSLLQNGVEIVDSPGLNESDVRTEITRKFFDRADAIMLILNCEQAFSASERSFLENELRDRDLRDVFFVWNRFDAIRDSPDDLQDIQRLSAEKLESRVGGRGRVFFVSARDALRARLQNDATFLTNSQIVPFERALEDFLANERGRVKMAGPYRLAVNAVEDALTKLIPQRESLIRKPVEELRALVEQHKPGLQAAERQQERILRTIDRRREIIEREAVAMIRSLVIDIESDVARAAGAIDIGTWEAITKQAATQQRIVDRLSSQVNQTTRSWEAGQFRPAMQTAFSELEKDLNDELGEFLSGLDDLEFNVSDARGPQAAATALSRLIGSVRATPGGELGSLVQMATGGRSGAMASIGVTVASGIAITVLHLPLLVVGGVLAALGLGRVLLGGQRRSDEIRRAAIDELTKAIRGKRDQMIAVTTEKLDETMCHIRSEIQDRMAIRIDEVRGQVEVVLRDKEKHETEASRQLEELEQCRQRIESLKQALTAIPIGADLGART